MADIFVSHSQKDREQVRLLAAFLEAEGYTVWWDKNLETADDFSEEVLKQLDLAKAVIVVWTENSEGSQLVRAEAQIANQNKKIVPVKAKSVEYDQLRPPFNVLHTEDLSNQQAILAAVEKQFSKSPEAPILWKQLRLQIFLLVAALGTAITIFSNMDGLLKLANWAKWLARYWHEYLSSLFAWIAQFFNFRFPIELTEFTAFYLFLIATAIGVKLNSKGHQLNFKRLILSYVISFSCLFLITLLSTRTSEHDSVNLFFVVGYLFLYLILILSPFFLIYKFRSISYRRIYILGFSIFFVFVGYVFLKGDLSKAHDIAFLEILPFLSTFESLECPEYLPNCATDKL